MSVLKVIKRTWKWLLLLVLIALVIDLSPLVNREQALNAEKAQTARQSAKQLADRLASSADTVNMQFDVDDVQSIAATISHLVPNTKVLMGYSPISLQAASTSTVNLPLGAFYINIFCELELGINQSHLKRCKLGDLPIPGVLIEHLLYSGLYVFFDKEVADTIDSLLSSVSFENKRLVVNASKAVNFRERVKKRIADAGSIAKLAVQSQLPSSDIITLYLNDIAGQGKSDSLMYYIRNTMQLASVRSIDNDPIDENKAALWALAISVGSGTFGKYSGIHDYPDNSQALLRERRDLTLHFIYSAIIAQIGGNEFSINTGELKEILDSGKGGSGFTFSDLAADNAGVAFSEALTKNSTAARLSQQILMKMTNEEVFFPFVHDMPDGLSQAEFKQLFNSTESIGYKKYVDMINQRIENSPLYAKTLQHTTVKEIYEFPSVNKIIDGKWLKIDTHVHSRYSDGDHYVDEIAQQAKRFACDAIAITDHGESRLDNEYFDAIRQAQNKHIPLTIIPGFEWNVPPFNGREHATVLFPENAALQVNFAQFKQRFDHYKALEPKFLSIKPALMFLNEIAQQDSVKPIVIYNHPSRKDLSSIENKHDLYLWQTLSPYVIGMSGAPGHQRDRADKNGSYNEIIRTFHGLDPMSRVGAEWDKLLQKGIRTLGARAASDFHNLRLDYWPCEFSSTHVYALSNSHNHVLSALRAGNTWAQHGGFVNALSFSVFINNTEYSVGERARIQSDTDAIVRIKIELEDKDWQGFDTSLDELELVVVTNRGIKAISLMSVLSQSSNSLNAVYSMKLPQDIKAIRLKGRSIQPEVHDYTVFTNPIFFNSSND